jgi:transposase
MRKWSAWEISDDFWALVEPPLPKMRREPGRIYQRKLGGGRKAKNSDRLYFAGSESLDARVVRLDEEMTENLCPDAGYVGKVAEVSARIPPIHPRAEKISESERPLDFILRRWIVECFHFWMNRFRKLIPRYEKADLSHLGLFHLWRKR